MKRFISLFLIIIFLFSIIPSFPAHAESKTITENIPFNPNPTFEEVDSFPMSLKGLNPRNITIHMSDGELEDYTLDGNKLTITAKGVQKSTGQYVTVIYNGDTHQPGYNIWLNSNKTEWYDQPPYSDFPAGPDGTMPSGKIRPAEKIISPPAEFKYDTSYYKLSELKDIKVKSVKFNSEAQYADKYENFVVNTPIYNNDGNRTGTNPGTWTISATRELTEEGIWEKAYTYKAPIGTIPPGTSGVGRNYLYPMVVDWEAKLYLYYRAGTVTYTYDEEPTPPGQVSFIEANFDVTTPIKEKDALELFDFSTSNPNKINRKEWTITGPSYNVFWVEDGDGKVTYGTKPATMNTAGNYEIELTVQNTLGERDSITKSLLVEESLASYSDAIAVDFYTNSPVYQGDLVTYRTYTENKDGGMVYLAWSNKQDKWDTPGIYEVSLTGYDAMGNRSRTVMKQIYVLEKVKAVDVIPGAKFALPNEDGTSPFPYFAYNTDEGIEAAAVNITNSLPFKDLMAQSDYVYHLEQDNGLWFDHRDTIIESASNGQYNILYRGTKDKIYKYVDNVITDVTPVYPTPYYDIKIARIKWAPEINKWLILYEAYYMDNGTRYEAVLLSEWDGLRITNTEKMDNGISYGKFIISNAWDLYYRNGKYYVEYTMRYSLHDKKDYTWYMQEYNLTTKEEEIYNSMGKEEFYYTHERILPMVYNYSDQTLANGTRYWLDHKYDSVKLSSLANYPDLNFIRYGTAWKYSNQIFLSYDTSLFKYTSIDSISNLEAKQNVLDYTPYTPYVKNLLTDNWVFGGNTVSYQIMDVASSDKYDLFAGWRLGEDWNFGSNYVDTIQDIITVPEIVLMDGFNAREIELPGLPTDKEIMVTSAEWIEPTTNMEGHFIISLLSYRWRVIGTVQNGSYTQDKVEIYDRQVHHYKYTPPDYLGEFQPAYFTADTDYSIPIGVSIPKNQFVSIDNVRGTASNPLIVKARIKDGSYTLKEFALDFHDAELVVDPEGNQYLYKNIPYKFTYESNFTVEIEADTTNIVYEQDAFKNSKEGNNLDSVTFTVKDWRAPDISLAKDRLKYQESTTRNITLYQSTSYIDSYEIYVKNKSGTKYIIEGTGYTGSNEYPNTSSYAVFTGKYYNPSDRKYYYLPLGEYDLYLSISSSKFPTLTSKPFHFMITNNQLPIPGFNISPATIYRNTTVSIASTASDPDGDAITYKYYVTNPEGNKTYYTSQANWNRTFTTLGIWGITQDVTDSKGETASLTKNINVVNRKPTVTITQPSSTLSSSPTLFNTTTPIFNWTYSDLDGDTQQRFKLSIYNASTNALVTTTYEVFSSSNSYELSKELAENITYYATI